MRRRLTLSTRDTNRRFQTIYPMKHRTDGSPQRKKSKKLASGEASSPATSVPGPSDKPSGLSALEAHERFLAKYRTPPDDLDQISAELPKTTFPLQAEEWEDLNSRVRVAFVKRLAANGQKNPDRFVLNGWAWAEHDQVVCTYAGAIDGLAIPPDAIDIVFQYYDIPAKPIHCLHVAAHQQLGLPSFQMPTTRPNAASELADTREILLAMQLEARRHFYNARTPGYSSQELSDLIETDLDLAEKLILDAYFVTDKPPNPTAHDHADSTIHSVAKVLEYLLSVEYAPPDQAGNLVHWLMAMRDLISAVRAHERMLVTRDLALLHQHRKGVQFAGRPLSALSESIRRACDNLYRANDARPWPSQVLQHLEGEHIRYKGKGPKDTHIKLATGTLARKSFEEMIKRWWASGGAAQQEARKGGRPPKGLEMPKAKKLDCTFEEDQNAAPLSLMD